jgi:hypothetical protein
MRINIEAHRTDIEPAFHWIGGLIGADLDRRVAGFERQERKNPLLTNHFRENFPLEFALAKARKYRKSTGRLPKGDEYDHLYGFLIPAHRIDAALPVEARIPYEGRLRYAVNSAYGARPFAYEISIASHLMGKGWDIDFADYSGAARFDFLARRDSAEIEVECKSTSGDTGRKIHRQEVVRLADLLLPTTEQLADVAGCHFIRVILPDRLGKSNEELSHISSTVADAAVRRGAASNDLAQVEYNFKDLASWPQPGRDEGAREFFEQRFGYTNSNLLFHGRPNFSVVAVMIRSAKADKVVDAISGEAKDAADQCSGTRPALLAIHLIDQIGRAELHELLTSQSGLHTITHAVFKDDKRLHVVSVAFTVSQVARTDNSGATRLSGNAVGLYNPTPKFSCPAVRSIFRA